MICIVIFIQFDFVNLIEFMVWVDFWFVIEFNFGIFCVSFFMFGIFWICYFFCKSFFKFDLYYFFENGINGINGFSKLKNSFNFGIDMIVMEDLYVLNKEVYYKMDVVVVMLDGDRVGMLLRVNSFEEVFMM